MSTLHASLKLTHFHFNNHFVFLPPPDYFEVACSSNLVHLSLYFFRMSSSHINNNDEAFHGIGGTVEWHEEIVPANNNHPHDDGAKEDLDASYDASEGDGGLTRKYEADDMEGYEDNNYDSRDYAYQMTQQTGSKGGSSFATKFGTTLAQAAAATYTNAEYFEDDEEEEYDEEYDDDQNYDDGVLMSKQGSGEDPEKDGEMEDDQDYYNAKQEGNATLRYYDDVIREYGDDYDIDTSNIPIGENDIVPGIRVKVDEMHNGMRSLTNKLLQEMEAYVQSLVKTEQTYLAIQQQELAESQRLDQCEEQVANAIAGFSFGNTQDDEDEQEDYQDNEHDYEDEEGETYGRGHQKVYRDDEGNARQDQGNMQAEGGQQDDEEDTEH
jgi:hypothetical protein